MAFLDLFIQSLLVAMTFMTLVFVVAYSMNKRYDLIDTAWGLVFIVIAWYSFAASSPTAFSGYLVLILVTIWGLRLASHIFRRWRASGEEDPRYVELRKNWPYRLRTLQMFARIYLTQGLLACIVSLPVMVVMYQQGAVSGWVIAGSLVWLAGFVFESVGDQQLRAYLAGNPGKDALMTEGLWKYSRHPNYFGEVTQWWGIALIGLSTSLGWVGFIGAAAITILIVYISGVPPAERRASRKPGWAEYERKTSVLFPLPPR